MTEVKAHEIEIENVILDMPTTSFGPEQAAQLDLFREQEAKRLENRRNRLITRVVELIRDSDEGQIDQLEKLLGEGS